MRPFCKGPILGLVPARGGSKRLPGKNITKFPLHTGYGSQRPLLDYTLKAAREAPSITHVVVSSEDQGILATAEDYDSEVVGLKRPDELASDHADSVDVVLHALDHFEQEGLHFLWVVLLQPTSPLRSPADIELCLQLAKIGHGGGVVSINAVTGDRNGAVYVATPAQLREAPTMGDPWTWDETTKYPMPPERSVDIDNEGDLRLASWLYIQGRGGR